MTKQQNLILQEWLSTVTQPHGWESLYDLHIDEIDPALKASKKEWLSESIRIYNTILGMIDKSKHRVFLSIPLTRHFKIQALPSSFFDIGSMMLSATPPSIYLFPRSYEPTGRVRRFRVPEFSRELQLTVEYYDDLVVTERINELQEDDVFRALSIWKDETWLQ